MKKENLKSDVDAKAAFILYLQQNGFENAKVVATGGLGNIIVSETDVIDIYDKNLTLEGLRIIYEKRKKAE